MISLAALCAVGGVTGGLGCSNEAGALPEIEMAQRAADAGDWALAAEKARTRLKLAPSDPAALRLLARASAHLNRPEIALGLYEKLGEKNLEPVDTSWVAHQLSDRNRKGAALKLLRAPNATSPDAPDGLLLAAKLLMADSLLSEAEPFARRLTTVPGWQARGWLLLAQIEEGQTRLDEAASAYLAAFQAGGGPTGMPEQTMRDRAARALLRAGRFAEAGKMLQPAQPGSAADLEPETAWLLARVLLHQGDRAGAGSMLAKASSLELDPMTPEPSPFAGAEACASCHAAIYKSQQSSHHSTTFTLGAGLGSLAGTQAPVPDPANPDVTYQVENQTGRPVLRVSVGTRSATAQGEFGFGSGDRGMTLVGHDQDGALRELRLSSYGDAHGWDITTGHPRIPDDAKKEPNNPFSYLGERLTEDESWRCFDCHTTSSRYARDQIEPLARDHSIGCEKCHGPAATHVASMNAQPAFSDLAIQRPRLASAAASIQVCAQCHSPGSQPVSPNDPGSIRFQGTTLTWSRCYTESQGALSCVTCHDPHRDAVSQPRYYEEKCLTCHRAPDAAPPAHAEDDGAHPIELTPGSLGRVCPVNATDSCLECHMPVKTNAVPHTRFTDHFIRVPRAGK